MKRGDVAWAELAPRSGSEQKGRRPVIIVSHDGFNQTPNWRSIIVVPITSSPRAKKGPTSIPLAAGTGGLEKDSFALCHQITTLDRRKISSILGALPVTCMDQVAQGIRIAVDIL